MARIEKREKRLLIVLAVILSIGLIDFVLNKDNYLAYYSSFQKEVAKKVDMPVQNEAKIKDTPPVVYSNTWGNDPFYDPSLEVKKAPVRTVSRRIYLTLKAISFSQGKSVAMINSQILAEGDRIEGYTIKKIKQKEVILEQAGNIKILKL